MVSFARVTLWDRIVAWYHRSVFYELFRHLTDDIFGVRFGSYEKIALGEDAERAARNLILAVMAAILVASAIAVYTKAVPGGFIRRLLRMGVHSPDKAVSLYESGYFRSFGVRRDLKRGGALAKLVCRPDDDGRTLAGTLPEAEAADPDPNGKPSLVDRLNADARPAPQSAETTAEKAESAGSAAETSESAENANGAESESEGAGEVREPEPLRPVNFYTDRFYIPEALRIRAELRFEKGGSGIRSFLLAAIVTVVAGALLCRLLPLLFRLADGILSLI